jgi:serine/threonine protein phosphatase PrpC
MNELSSGFFAVYDGHGGKEAADLVSTELHKFLELELGKIDGSVHESFVKVCMCMYVFVYIYSVVYMCC